MSFDLKISGATSNNLAEVDSNNRLKIANASTEALAGFVSVCGENDSGSITGVRKTRSLEISPDFRLRTATDMLMFNDTFTGAAYNTASWTQPVTTMTATVSGGFAVLNAGLSVASGAVARVQTWRSFPIYKTYTTMAEMEVQFSQLPQTSNVCEWGFAICTGTAAPTDGVFFRLNASGEFRCIMNFNGTETQSSALNFSSLIGLNTTRQFLIYAGSTIAQFWIDNILVAEIPTPIGQGSCTASMSLPLCFRNYNSAATSAAQVMRVGNVNVTLGDIMQSKPWAGVIAGMGGGAYQGQNGFTMGTTALYTNSLAAGAGAAATNTTAALGSGLGGQFALLPTLTVGTDGIISSYQVPAGTAALPGKSLYITGVTIQGAVTTVLAGGALLNAWSLAFGHTAVSLATAESATTKAPRRLPLGYDSFALNAAAGTVGSVITQEFRSAVVVNPGEFIQTVCKNLGTVTTTGVVTYLICFEGYFE